MTIEEVRSAVSDIDEIKGDDEVAHEKEDDLRNEVLQAIANGASNPKDLALEVLKTGSIDFARWCA